jgi:hypothetical protein
MSQAQIIEQLIRTLESSDTMLSAFEPTRFK